MEKILDFIKRRFCEDNHWTDGNCYWAARILCERFSELEMCYCPVEGHFVVMDGRGRLYDGHGLYHCNDTFVLLSEIKSSDPLWYLRLMRDCRD